jgi:Ca2+-binding EF-hand superfamily protein
MSHLNVSMWHGSLTGGQPYGRVHSVAQAEEGADPRARRAAPKETMAERLALPSPEVRAALWERHDPGGAGRLDYAGVEAAVAELWPGMRNQQAFLMAYRVTDAKDSGALERRQFAPFLASLEHFYALWRQFKLLDRDGEEGLSLAEFAAGCEGLRLGIGRTAAAQAFDQMDEDHSGAVDYDEFLQWVIRHLASPVGGIGVEWGEASPTTYGGGPPGPTGEADPSQAKKLAEKRAAAEYLYYLSERRLRRLEDARRGVRVAEGWNASPAAVDRRPRTASSTASRAAQLHRRSKRGAGSEPRVVRVALGRGTSRLTSDGGFGLAQSFGPRPVHRPSPHDATEHPRFRDPGASALDCSVSATSPGYRTPAAAPLVATAFAPPASVAAAERLRSTVDPETPEGRLQKAAASVSACPKSVKDGGHLIMVTLPTAGAIKVPVFPGQRETLDVLANRSTLALRPKRALPTPASAAPVVLPPEGARWEITQPKLGRGAWTGLRPGRATAPPPAGRSVTASRGVDRSSSWGGSVTSDGSWSALLPHERSARARRESFELTPDAGNSWQFEEHYWTAAPTRTGSPSWQASPSGLPARDDARVSQALERRHAAQAGVVARGGSFASFDSSFDPLPADHPAFSGAGYYGTPTARDVGAEVSELRRSTEPPEPEPEPEVTWLGQLSGYGGGADRLSTQLAEPDLGAEERQRGVPDRRTKSYVDTLGQRPLGVDLADRWGAASGHQSWGYSRGWSGNTAGKLFQTFEDSRPEDLGRPSDLVEKDEEYERARLDRLKADLRRERAVAARRAEQRVKFVAKQAASLRGAVARGEPAARRQHERWAAGAQSRLPHGARAVG